MVLAMRTNACALSLIVGFWDRLVIMRAALLRLLGPFSWVILGVLFMVLVLAFLRAGGKTDAADL